MSLASPDAKYRFEVSAFRCRACDGEIPFEASYHAAILLDGEGFTRSDHCGPCWAGKGPEILARSFAHWRAKRPARADARPRRPRFDPQVIWELFTRLASEAPEPGAAPAGGATEGERSPAAARAAIEARFFLALLLIRRKVLLLGGTTVRDGVEWLRLPERQDPARVHWVLNPELREADLERVKDALGNLLQMQL